MAKPDRHFVNVFSAVIGILVAIALVLIGISRLVDSGPKGARDTGDPLMQASAHERIKPFGQVAVAGEDNSALAIKQTAVPVAGRRPPAAGAAAMPTDGKSVVRCPPAVACHGTGIAGAPADRRQGRLGAAHRAGRRRRSRSTPSRASRAQTGMMPAKGGRTDLSDDAVRAAVEYMAAQSR